VTTLPAGSVSDIFWTEVKVGDYLMVKDDELFPADLVCIYSALPDKVREAAAGRNNFPHRSEAFMTHRQEGGVLPQT
jgi:hypothetical protein